MITDVELAADLYVAGYPLVVSTRTFQRLAARNGLNRFAMQTELSGPRHRTIVAPNQDTLYSMAVLDLRDGPLLLTHPPLPDRYFSLQFLDMWTESFHYIGTRATGGRGGRWLIAGPGWAGTPPPDAELVRSSTAQLFVLGRYLVDGAADVDAVLAIGRDVDVTPWSSQPAATRDPGRAPGRAQEVPTDAAFFDELGEALAVNPPTSQAQRALFAGGERLGVGPLLRPTRSADAATIGVLDRGAAAGAARIAGQRAKSAGPWGVDLVTGRYGERLLLRAQVARLGWGANVPEESLYALARQDSNGWLLHGSNRYVVPLAARVPPVDAFWSLTAYGPDMFFAEHPAGRYAITRRAEARDDTRIVVAHTAPDDVPAAEWLPVPSGPFVLMLRLYLPRPEAIDGTYRFPEIELIAP
jgi:hypothetical protein